MAENLMYVTVGALGAVLATIVLLLLAELWIAAVPPLWRRWRYRGVNIAGGWKGLGNDTAPAAGTWTEVGLTLAQDAREVRGQLWIRRGGGTPADEVRLAVAGTIAGGYLTLGPTADGEAATPLATALLKIEGRGPSLNGQLLYRHADGGMIEGIQVSVHRAESMALPRLRAIDGAFA